MKPLVTFFSAQSRKTADLATALAFILGADRFEFMPEPPYTKDDLDYENPDARVNREAAARQLLPMRGRVENFEAYDLVLLGFPIWWGAIPLAVKSFCDGYDWTGKRVYVFTTGWDDVSRFPELLRPYMLGAEIVEAKLFKNPNVPEFQRWANKLKKEIG